MKITRKDLEFFAWNMEHKFKLPRKKHLVTYPNGNTYETFGTSIYFDKGASSYLSWDSDAADEVLKCIVQLINCATGLSLEFDGGESHE